MILAAAAWSKVLCVSGEKPLLAVLETAGPLGFWRGLTPLLPKVRVELTATAPAGPPGPSALAGTGPVPKVAASVCPGAPAGAVAFVSSSTTFSRT